MTSAPKIPVVFDVLGTCFSWSAATSALEKQFGSQLREKGLNAGSLVDDWFHSAQRDFTYLSMNGEYKPIAHVLKTSLPRILSMAGLTSSPSPPYISPFSTSDLSPILSTIPTMDARPSLSPCAKSLAESGKFRLMAATNGGAESTRGLYVRALGEKEGGEETWEVFSCDEVKVAKPAPAVYEAIWKRLGLEGNDRKAWFVASHTWDLFAAKKAGFRTAWVAYEEHLVVEEMYGKPDIVAPDLEDAARQIIAWEA